MINPADAVAAYNQHATPVPSAPTVGGNDVTTPVRNFSEILRGTAEEMVQANRVAEKVGMDAIAGKAELTEVVAALAHAESTLQTVVTVRDKMIQAYQEILRMPI